MKKLIRKNYAQVILVFITFALMVAIGGYFVSNTLQKASSTAVNIALEETNKTVRAYLREPKVAFDNIYAAIVELLDRGEPQETVLRYLNQISELLRMQEDGIEGFIDVYGFIRNEFLSGSSWVPSADYVPQQRPWYQLAVRSEVLDYTVPYIDAMTGLPIISLSQELYGKNGDYYGVLALDISIEWLFDYSESLQFVDGGYGIIVSQYLHIIAHPEERFRSERLQDLGADYAIIADILRVERAVSGQRILDTDGRSSIVFFKQLFNGWYAGVVLPVSSYMADVVGNTAMLAALGFVLACVLSYILLRLAADKIRSEEESKSKSSFLAMMSHEMRTPMNAIIGMTNIAKSTQSVERKDYALGKIEDASNHLLGVINNILDMSKIEADKLELNPVVFDFAEMIDKVISIVNFRVAEKQLKLSVDIDEKIPRLLKCDDQRLAQVITNLLSNSVKFTPEHGSIDLRARLSESESDICEIRFDVTDSGVGISEEHQAALFMPFQQADSSTSHKYGGTGLGLALSKRIVELMEGSISVSSALGEGATFTFTVKAETAGDDEKRGIKGEQYQEENAEPLQPDNFFGHRALLVEDVEINREIVISLLEHTKIEIDCAENGAEAVRLYSKQPEVYGIILMDVQMPVMDGFEATRIIRSLSFPNAKTIPIIAMTANVFKDDVDNCLKAGMNSHIGKPIDINAVLQVLRQYLGPQSSETDRRKDDRRRSPGDRRRSPGDRRRSPGDRRESPGDRRESPGDRREEKRRKDS